MSKPLVTIITPVYNHENYLEEYFNSIMNQSYQNIELVLIDDASPDNSQIVIEKWLHKLEERFVNLTYIPRTDNKGLLYNCNEGLSYSKGRYVNISNSDDVMLPTNIEEKVSFLEKNSDYAMVYSDAYSGIDPNSLGNRRSKHNTHPEGNIFKDLIDRGNFIISATVLIRKEVVHEVGGYSTKYTFEDYPMWLEVAYKYKIGYINEPLVFYRFTPNSLSRGVENYKIMINSQEQLLYDIEKKYSVNTELALQKMYIDASVFFLKYNRTQYKYYRNKIIKIEWKILATDMLFFLRITPTTMGFISRFYGWRKFFNLQFKSESL